MVHHPAVEPELAGALAGAAAGGGMAALTQFVLDRRREHAEARSVARMVAVELDQIAKYLSASIEDRSPWEGDEFDLRTWTDHAHLIAGELADDELLTLNETVSWIKAANRWRASRGSGPLRRLGFGPQPEFTNADEELLRIVLGVVEIARSAIAPLRRGRRLFLWRRRIPTAVGPDLRAPCRCGHAFGEHEHTTKRRWIRVTHPRASHEDRASSCAVCDCTSFVYAGDAAIRRVLRRARIIPQAPVVFPNHATASGPSDHRSPGS